MYQQLRQYIRTQYFPLTDLQIQVEIIACVCTDVIADTSNSLLISYKIIFERTAGHQQKFLRNNFTAPSLKSDAFANLQISTSFC